MDFGSIPEVMAALTALLVAFGGGIKWMLVWSDGKVEEVQTRLEAQYLKRFTELEDRVSHQEEELRHQRRALSRYMRHVGRLEGLLQANGIDVPHMEEVDGQQK